MKSDFDEISYTPSEEFNFKTENNEEHEESSTNEQYMPEAISRDNAYQPSKIDPEPRVDYSPLIGQEEIVHEETTITTTEHVNNEYDPEVSLGNDFKLAPIPQTEANREAVQEEENDFDGFEEDEQIGAGDAGGMIADIFGESDAEEEFEGFAENEVQDFDENNEQQNYNEHVPSKRRKQSHQLIDEYNDDNDAPEDGAFVSDFDMMMSKKKSRRSKRQNDVDLINDNDDLVASVITKMRRAAEEDRIALESDRPGYKKLSMIKLVITILKKADIKTVLIENGMMSAITDWLSPVRKNTLPNLLIRETLLKALMEFQQLSPDVLKESGIGKAVMYLFKHPKETRENKIIASRLINEWSRPIFNLQNDYRSLSKEERRQLNAQQVSNRSNREDKTNEDGNDDKPTKPGDPDWVSRARVPQPSTRDYVVAPKWNLPEDERNQLMNTADYDDEHSDRDKQAMIRRNLAKTSKNEEKINSSRSRIESNIRDLSRASGKKQRSQKAVSMSLEGRKMIL